MTDTILSLLGRKRKPAGQPTSAEVRVYEAAVRQVLARRELWGEMPQQTAPYDRPENATRRVSLPRRAA